MNKNYQAVDKMLKQIQELRDDRAWHIARGNQDKVDMIDARIEDLDTKLGVLIELIGDESDES